MSISLPLIAVTPILHFPSTIFFESQAQSGTCQNVGEVEEDDFNLSIASSLVDGTSFVYKTSAKGSREVLRVFVYGEIEEMKSRVAETVSGVSCVEVQTTRITLKRPTLSTEQASMVHQNDVIALSNIIASERGPKSAEKWVWFSDAAHTEDGRIFVECGPNTKVVSGPLYIGAWVLFEATLHRYDSYHAGCTSIQTVYSIIAHAAEAVHKGFLQRTGWIRPDFAIMPVDEAIAIVQCEMKNVRI